jgi:hypothetical protein
MLHRNIAPEAILINQHGAWKIAGFEYCLGKTWVSCNQSFGRQAALFLPSNHPIFCPSGIRLILLRAK